MPFETPPSTTRTAPMDPHRLTTNAVTRILGHQTACGHLAQQRLSAALPTGRSSTQLPAHAPDPRGRLSASRSACGTGSDADKGEGVIPPTKTQWTLAVLESAKRVRPNAGACAAVRARRTAVGRALS